MPIKILNWKDGKKMNRRLSEIVKINTPLPPFNLVPATPASSRGYLMTEFRKALFCARFRNIASTDNDIVFSVMEASDIAGATARNIGNALAAVDITLRPHTEANSITLTMNTPLVNDEMTINGLVFTAAAAANFPNRVYDQSGNVAAQAASLVGCINANFADLVATTDGISAVTIRSLEPGDITVTVEGITAEASVIPVTDEIVGYIEIDASAMSNGFPRLVARVTPGAIAAAITGDVTLIRGNSRYNPVPQQAADSGFAPEIV